MIVHFLNGLKMADSLFSSILIQGQAILNLHVDEQLLVDSMLKLECRHTV